MIVAVTLLAILVGVTYVSRCARHAMRETQVLDYDPLPDFASAYGRLCVLVGTTLEKGYEPTLVTEAALGKGELRDKHYVELRRQRVRVNDAVDACKQAGVSKSDFVAAGRRVKHTLDAEFMRNLPMTSVGG